MQVTLNNLQSPPGSRKARTRRGRGVGSGLAKTAGRGGKGQTARTGSGRKIGFEGGQTPLHRRLPKFGFRNLFRKTFEVVNLNVLESRFQSGDTVDLNAMIEKRLIKSQRSLVKILGEGNLTKKLTIKAHAFSKAALKKINQAGGQVEEIAMPGARPSK